MLTKIGVQILDELKSELDSDVEDHRKKLAMVEVGNTVKSIWHLFWKLLYVIYFYMSLALVLAFIFIDESTVNALFSSPISKTLDLRDTIVQGIVMFSFLTFLVVIVTKNLGNERSAKEQLEAENKRIINDTSRQIELIEEVLYRHHLINKKEL